MYESIWERDCRILTGTDAGLQTVTTSGSICRIETSHAITGGSCLQDFTNDRVKPVAKTRIQKYQVTQQNVLIICSHQWNSEN